MDFGIKGKVALVVASSSGLGKAVAMELAKEGAKLSLCARNEARLLAAAQEISAATGIEILAVPADVTKASDVESLINKTVARFGQIDILVNNAGGPPTGAFESFNDEEWAKAIELNLLSTVRLTREVLPHMKKTGAGRIINITSMTVKQPLEGFVLSNSIRAGVTGLAKTLSNELAKHNITVNCVLPGWTATDRVLEIQKARAKRENRTEEDIRAEIERSIPIGRMAEPEEFGATVAFLTSERASYITGVSLQVDGGFIKGLI
jgi:3-oxoacyl-[acyl-carrier protein] reductase